jgi:putative ABC transport system permease protein
MIELRTKEIGIRKSLGASFTKILALLSKDYLKLIIIANTIAWPLSFMIENSMSNLYFYKIDFAYWLFIAAGSFVLLIALAAVGMQSVRAARTNPVKALRYE